MALSPLFTPGIAPTAWWLWSLHSDRFIPPIAARSGSK